MSCDPSLVGSMASASECQQVWDGKLQTFLDSQCGLAPWQGLTFYSLGPRQPFLPLKGSQHSSGLPSDVYQAQRNKYCLVVWVSESHSQDLFPDTQITLLQRHCANCFWKASPLPVFSLPILPSPSFCFLSLLRLPEHVHEGDLLPPTAKWWEIGSLQCIEDTKLLQTRIIIDHLYLPTLKIRNAGIRIQWPLHPGAKECLTDFRGTSLKAHIVQSN